MVSKIGLIVANAIPATKPNRLGWCRYGKFNPIRRDVARGRVCDRARRAVSLTFDAMPDKLSAKNFVSKGAFGGSLDIWPRTRTDHGERIRLSSVDPAHGR
jgi:hypothetical protein